MLTIPDAPFSCHTVVDGQLARYSSLLYGVTVDQIRAEAWKPARPRSGHRPERTRPAPLQRGHSPGRAHPRRWLGW
ncbi:MAG: hypothetical protein R2856_04810 [Caldilineaceae bacterium]